MKKAFKKPTIRSRRVQVNFFQSSRVIDGEMLLSHALLAQSGCGYTICQCTQCNCTGVCI